MARFLLAATLCLAIASPAFAQQAADSPASKEDVARYFQAAHSQELVRQVLDVMSKYAHQMVHDQYMKDRDKLPPDFEERTNKLVDDTWKNMPIDEMLEASVPAYQKHFTKGDLEVMTAFTSSPTGQKVLRELPAVMSDSMLAMQPILQRQMEATRQRVQQEIEAAEKKSTTEPGTATPSN
jgi:hypothetical protein